VEGLGFNVQGLRFRVQGVGSRVEGFEVRVSGVVFESLCRMAWGSAHVGDDKADFGAPEDWCSDL
jgi:hypothetical protein